MGKKTKGVETIEEANDAIFALRAVHQDGWVPEKLADGNYVLVFQKGLNEKIVDELKDSNLKFFAKKIAYTKIGNTHKLTISNGGLIKCLANGADGINQYIYNVISPTESSDKSLTQTTSTVNIVDTLNQKPYNSKDKKKSEFSTVKKLAESEASGKISHEVTIDKKHKTPKNDWYSKRVQNPVLAKREVVAQELFRLFINHQPKTRLVIDESNPEYAYVNSKAVQGFTPLEKMPSHRLSSDLLSGKFKGLGEVSVIALLLGESDFKFGNMGVDKDNNVTKLDGGWCFGSMQDEKRKDKIRKATIADLPCADVGAYNWLDYIVGGQKCIPQIANLRLQNNPAFREEVNTAILKVLLLPDPLFYRLIEHYISDHKEIKNLTTFIIKRKNQLREAALQNKSFLEFIGTSQANRVISTFDAYINNFILTGKIKLLDSNINKFIRKLFDENKDQLISDAFRAEEKLEAQPKNEKKDLRSSFSNKANSQFKHS